MYDKIIGMTEKGARKYIETFHPKLEYRIIKDGYAYKADYNPTRVNFILCEDKITGHKMG